jgi:DNA mismatch endonuclease, patch repair protein
VSYLRVAFASAVSSGAAFASISSKSLIFMTMAGGRAVGCRTNVPPQGGSRKALGEMTRGRVSAQRSRTMRAVRSQGNRSTEMRFCAALSSMGVRGWRKHPPLQGNPDIVFELERVVVFLDGCFWHKCPDCARRAPQTRRSYWKPKLQRNAERDRFNTKVLQQQGWTVLRIWEHTISVSPARCVEMVRQVLRRQRELKRDT